MARSMRKGDGNKERERESKREKEREIERQRQTQYKARKKAVQRNVLPDKLVEFRFALDTFSCPSRYAVNT